MKVEEE